MKSERAVRVEPMGHNEQPMTVLLCAAYSLQSAVDIASATSIVQCILLPNGSTYLMSSLSNSSQNDNRASDMGKPCSSNRLWICPIGRRRFSCQPAFFRH